MVTTSMLTKRGILRGTIKYLSDNNYLEKVSTGVYDLTGMILLSFKIDLKRVYSLVI